MDHAQEHAAAGYRVSSWYLVHNFDSVRTVKHQFKGGGKLTSDSNRIISCVSAREGELVRVCVWQEQKNYQVVPN